MDWIGGGRVILRLTVVDRATGDSLDAEVTAQPNNSVASLLAVLPFADGNRPCYVGRHQLDPNTTIADSHIVHGCVISIGAPGDDLVADHHSLGALHVRSGPDAGLTVCLPAGTHTIGTAPDCVVRLTDPHVQPHHSSLVVGPGVATLHSHAGTSPLHPAMAERNINLADGSTAEIGANVVEWLPIVAIPGQRDRTPDGRLIFDRAYAPAPGIRRLQLSVPNEPTTTHNSGALWASLLVPMLLAGAAALFFRSPAMLLFVLLGPLTFLASFFIERRQRKAQRRDYEGKMAALRRQIKEHVADEESRRRALAPTAPALMAAAVGATRGLWPRNLDDPDGLVLRLGTGDEPASVDITSPDAPPDLVPPVRDVPITVDLRKVGVLGVVGPPSKADGLLRWLIVQLAVLRSPDGLRLVVLTDVTSTELAWTSWLPHVDAGEGGDVRCWIGNTPETRAARLGELRELITARKAELTGTTQVRFDEVVVILHGALSLRGAPGMRDLLLDGPSVGIYVIACDIADINECRAVCRIDEHGATLQLARDADVRPLEVEHISLGAAQRVARALAPMRDRLSLAGAQAAVPFPVRLLDLFGIRYPTVADVLARWSGPAGPKTNIILGADAAGVVAVDLAKDGPHAMLGGATGAGKSLMLQALVTSLLLANRPDELNLVLVDFKGGSTFKPFERCPHVVGLILSTGETPADVFDDAAAARVLASVASEVRRRESILARYGGEIDRYWEECRTDPTLPRLPRLVMIFDEFARVLETFPDFLKQLVNVAAKGRSLGMHLILSTQSLQGKLSAELKNNIDLRITLRQNEVADSIEVLGVPDAAFIPGRLRGRAIILRTKDEARTPRLFQSGYVGAPPPEEGPPPVQSRVVPWQDIGKARPEYRVEAPTNKPTDLEAVVDAIIKASPPIERFLPLRPPLPATLTLDDLDEHRKASDPVGLAPFGLIDDPAAQDQPLAGLDLNGSNRILVAGGPQSGRTTFVRTLVASLVRKFSPDDVHIYILERDTASTLSSYERLPHCGGVFTPLEPDRIRRFVTWLDHETQSRAARSVAAGGDVGPAIVFIIDGWEHFENRADPSAVETSLTGILRTVIANGPPVRVHVVAVAGQDVLNGRLPTLYATRILLPFPKEETRRQHVASGVITPPLIPGRAIEAVTGRHVQLATSAYSVDELANLWPAAVNGPRRFSPMPVDVAFERLPVPANVTPGWIPLGVGGPDVEVLGVDLFESATNLLLVSGPSGSGRTHALLTVAAGLRRIGVAMLVIAPPRSPLPELLPSDDSTIVIVRGTSVKDADLRARASVFAGRRFAILVDDCEQITVVASQQNYVDVPTLLHETTDPAALGQRALVMAGDALPIIAGQRRSLARVVEEMLGTGVRILLSPADQQSSRPFGLKLEADQFFVGPPGRGYLNTGRVPGLVQLAKASRA